MKISAADRLEKYTFKTSCGCHLWTGAVFDNGYGVFRIGGKNKKAHRVAFEQAHGVLLEPAQKLLHSCDVRNCINPAHLSVGTCRDNTLDCLAKGRYRNKWGPTKRVVDAPLIAEVLSALASGERGCDVAARLGIGRPMVSRIKHGMRVA